MRSTLLILLALLVAPLMPRPAHATALRVGSGAGCTHADLGSAVQAAHEGDGIFINVGTYPVANLNFNGKSSLTFRGGYANCTAATPSTTDPHSTIIDAMNAGSVATLSGTTSVIFDTVTFTHGHAVSGGGIHFTGLGSLTFLNVAITANHATDGGGLDVEATGPTTVVMSTGTLISDNHADNDGGGVRLSGNVRLLFVGPQAAIANNTADDDENGSGDGGGLLLSGPAYADIASPGYDFPGGSRGAISGNTAVHGGGVMVRTGGILRLIETVYSQGRPTRIENNGDARTMNGGGIHANDSGTHVCGWGFRIANNRAQLSAALAGTGATVSFTSDVISSPCGSAPVAASGAVDCRAGIACNAIVGNTFIAETNTSIMTANTLQADRLEFRDNMTLGNSIAIKANAITVSNSLFANNTAAMLMRANAIDIGESTIAGNSGLAATLMTTGNAPSVSLSRSILWQPGIASVRIPDGTLGGNVVVFDTIAADAASFAGSGYGVSGQVIAADPRFVAPAAGNYHLALASPAIDYTFTGSMWDLERHPRGVNIRNAPDGRRNDIGAYEYTDAIFTDGFDLN